MQTQARTPSLDAPDPPSALTMDLAGLVGVLVSLRGPSRTVDQVVEAMLGGPCVVPLVSLSAVISSRWLSDETPAYTSGGGALSVLARRRGCRVRTSMDGSRHRAEATDSATGASAVAHAPTEGGAGLAAICSLAAKEAVRA